ncbi:MAG TPA: GIY-YIG nuclease family protein, partial [Candidatus Mediterraneibacter intestinigallinarum]|nr:GIY-YIG nuclease family protein [Candidatus Mediterraneibacter intestinigallinarum]
MKTSSIIVEKFENEDSGIYMILNLETKNIYIGKSLNLKRRME